MTNNERITKYLNSKFRRLISYSSLVIRHSRTRAFTLIELLVVMAIIGILIAIGSVSWISASARNRDSARKTDLQRYKQVLEQYYNDYRKYPVFDVNAPSIYAANWQLESNTTTCAHTGYVDNSPRLTAGGKYFERLPKDPKDATDYNSSCTDLRADQKYRYLYLSGTSDSNGPNLSPNVFGLLTTLERADTDLMDDSSLNNPFTKPGTIFGDWYRNQNLYNSVLNPNYLVTNKS